MLYYVDRDEMTMYRFEARALRNRDNREIARLRLEIDERAKNKDISDTDLLILYNWPVLKYGAAVFDYARLEALPETEDVPEGLDWQPVDLTEDKFSDLTEDLTILAFDAVMQRNQARRLEGDFLEVALKALQKASGNGLQSLRSITKNEETQPESS